MKLKYNGFSWGNLSYNGFNLETYCYFIGGKGAVEDVQFGFNNHLLGFGMFAEKLYDDRYRRIKFVFLNFYFFISFSKPIWFPSLGFEVNFSGGKDWFLFLYFLKWQFYRHFS